MNSTRGSAEERSTVHTNLVCMCCGHIQPVRRDRLPSRCEHCRESFLVHGYLLDEETTDAEDLSQEVLNAKAISHVTGGCR
ncbi:MAG TPA: hypothetical protein VK680_14000 [Solirubrobacteraceae bacterium]|nr:hypothetical protein [Solirubrobacteraceae bacterium]